MKGEEKLWSILNDKLDTLRAGNRLPEAIRVAETALDLAKRTFAEDESSLALSYEKLGQLLDQHGDRATAKAHLLKAHAILDKAKPPTNVLFFAPRVDLPFCAITWASPKKPSVFTRKRLRPAPSWKICPTRTSAPC